MGNVVTLLKKNSTWLFELHKQKQEKARKKQIAFVTYRLENLLRQRGFWQFSQTLLHTVISETSSHT